MNLTTNGKRFSYIYTITLTVIVGYNFLYKNCHLDPNCEEPFYETFDDFEENGYPLSLGISPNVCFFRNTTGKFYFNYTVVITTSDTSAFKLAYKVNLTDEDSLNAFNELVLPSNNEQ